MSAIATDQSAKNSSLAVFSSSTEIDNNGHLVLTMAQTCALAKVIEIYFPLENPPSVIRRMLKY
jgi:hypothetical protein